ncbi:TPA: hypothetical protein DD449_00540 [Candidatus Berkelbacteria bacterium]|uniref:Uncharacterized protein n=1 Tax=Berkelbacteria bacterium GW2011_GWE1_39_12 TaxID=1618337 RepID=A0A0G4B498_9BACT|nr:MAG: hypothetical protein UT28_C0001G0979 [Berkelbacteria bacterium GW2011_GWE1_39_12]HBO60158.1 hypothetical protein [Candidatus Berkelbacteria bacterium]
MPELFRSDKEQPINFDAVGEEKPEVLGTGLLEGDVVCVEGMISGSGGRQKEVQLAQKIFHTEGMLGKHDVEGHVKILLEKHAELKRRHLPTIPTMRIGEVDGDTRLFMTDLTRGGKNEVISNMDWESYFGRAGKYFQNDAKFELSNKEELSQNASDIFKQLVTKGCIARNDVFFVIMDKDTKKGQIILGDIYATELYSDSDLKSYSTRCKLQSDNFKEMNRFLLEINGHLSDESQIDLTLLKQAYDELDQKVFDGFDASEELA